MKHFFLTAIFLFSGWFIQAQILNIPDANFKYALVNTFCVDTNNDGYLDDDVDTNNDGEIQITEAEAVLWLNVSYNLIASLEGIQTFINLEGLDCHGNELENLDVTQNTKLEALHCEENQLTELIIDNSNLKTLLSDKNELTNLNLTQSVNLEKVWVSYNPISNLDLSQNRNLTHIFTTDNPMLSELNLKNGNNNNAVAIFIYNNPSLSCIQVDDINYAINQNCEIEQWCKDVWAEYSEDCALGVADFNNYTARIFPNPVKDILSIYSDFSIESIKIYNLQGQLINETENTQIDISLLSPGLYFASILLDGNSIIKKFIKE